MSRKIKPVRIDDLLPEHQALHRRTQDGMDAARKLNLEIGAAIDTLIRDNPTLAGSALEAEKSDIVCGLVAKHGYTLVDAERVDSPAELLAILDNPAEPMIRDALDRIGAVPAGRYAARKYAWAREETRRLGWRGWPTPHPDEDPINTMDRFTDWLRTQVAPPAGAGDGTKKTGIEKSISELQAPPQGVLAGDVALDDFVTMDQAAAAAGMSKRTLERHATTGKLPTPDVCGGGGRPHKWRWSNLRPALEGIARHALPAKWPGSRIA